MNARFLVLAAAPLLLVAGCATSPVRLADSRPVDSGRLLADYAFHTHPVHHGAKVIVIRDAGRVDAPESAEVIVDGRPVANLLPRERIDLYVYAGDRILGVGSRPGFLGAPQVYHSFLLRPGQTYYFRVGIVGGQFDIGLASLTGAR